MRLKDLQMNASSEEAMVRNLALRLCSCWMSRVFRPVEIFRLPNYCDTQVAIPMYVYKSNRSTWKTTVRSAGVAPAAF